MNVSLEVLQSFIVKAHNHTYAGEGAKVSATKPGANDYEYREGI